MKKSRSGLAILFLVFIITAFLVAVVAISLIVSGDDESSMFSSLVDYGPKVAVIKLEGTILSSDDILKQMRKFAKKSTVKAIVIRINSPGGTVAPAQEIYREIGRIKAKKPVVASIETVGASAAYYVASNANQIVCSKGSITGSIGVIMMLTDLHKLIEKLGVDVNVIKAGKFKDIGSGFRPMTDAEKNILETFAADVHEQFINDVAAGRKDKIDKENLRSIADGRFFTGEKAKEYGLVDVMGNFYDAVKIAGDLGGITGEIELLYHKSKWNSWVELLTESMASVVGRVLERDGATQSVPQIR